MTETVSDRSAKLYQLLMGKAHKREKYRLFDWEPLLDAFLALYDVCCTTEEQKKHKQVEVFVKKYKSAIDGVRRMRPNKDDFEFIRAIGRGHFGEVYVVKERGTDDVYAMKILKKAATLSNDNIAFYEEERDIMAFAASPWVTALQYAFQDTENLYLVMEFLPGGDLLNLLTKYNDGVMEEEDARFYLCEIILAVHAVHVLGYVHRDVKPENILLDMTGHIKLADFGSAARLLGGKSVLCKMPVGTPEYIAPEVLQSMNKGGGIYGHECDWWSVGVMCYEMLCGCLPFEAEGVLKLYSQIMNFKTSLEFPDDVELSDTARLLIFGLLEHQKERMTYAQLAQHAFFGNTDWTTLREIQPPYIPQLSDATDTSHFGDFRAVKPQLSRPPQPTLNSTMPFIGFTFTKNISAPITENLRPKSLLSHHNSVAEDTDNRSKNNVQISQLNQQLNDQFRKTQELENDLKNFKKEHSLKQKTIEQLASQKETLETKCNELQRQLELVSQESQETKTLHNTIEGLQSQLKYQKTALDSLQDERGTAISDASSLIQKLELVEKAKEEAIQSLKSTENRSLATQLELRGSIKELQSLLETTNLEYQERLRASFEEVKRYRELREELLQKTTHSAQQQEALKPDDSQQISDLNQKMAQSSERFEELKHQFEALDDRFKTQETQLQTSQINVVKLTQHNREMEHTIRQNDQKVGELKEKLSQTLEQLTCERTHGEQLATENTSIARSLLERERRLCELEEQVQTIKSSFNSEKATFSGELNKLKVEIATLKSRIVDKTDELNSVRAQLNEAENEAFNRDTDVSKTKQEIEHLTAIISAQKASNFALSQDLEEINIRINCLEAENEEISTNSFQLVASHREQLYKLETTIYQQNKLINFLHAEPSKKKGGKLGRTVFDPKKGAPLPTNQRRARDVEQQLELERMQTLKLNNELLALRKELKKYKLEAKRPSVCAEITKQNTFSDASVPVSLNDVSDMSTPTKEHSLIATHCSIPNLCFVCFAPITFSQPIYQCTHCLVFCHTRCQAGFPHFFCPSHSPLSNFNALFNFTNLNRFFPDLDEFEPILPYTGWLSVPHQVGHNKFDWHKRSFELSVTCLTISNTEESEPTVFGRINFEDMATPCRVLQAVHTSDIFFTPLANWPYILGLELPRSESAHFELNMGSIGIERDPSQTNTVLFMFAESMEVKRLWVRLLNKVINNKRSIKPDPTQPLYLLDTKAYPNVVAIECLGNGQLAVGYKRGILLLCLEDKVVVDCFETELECHCLFLVSNTLFAILGNSRQLARLKTEKVKSVLQLSIKKHTLSPAFIPDLDACFSIHAGEQRGDGVVVIVSRKNELVGIRVTSSHTILFRVTIGDVPPPSVVLVDNTVLFCQDKFYVFDIEKKVKKELLDASDNSLAFLIYGSSLESNYPMAIFRLHRGPKQEFLICCSEFGLVVDSSGHRVSSGDIRWDELPLSFRFFNDTLCVCYPHKLEIRTFKQGSFENLNDSAAPVYRCFECPLILGPMHPQGPILVRLEDFQLAIYRLPFKDHCWSHSGSLPTVEAQGDQPISATPQGSKRPGFFSRKKK